MKTTLDIDDQLFRRAKAVAALRRTSLKSLVEHALRREVSSPGDAVSSRHIGEGPYGIPVLIRTGSARVTSSEVHNLMDQEDT